MSFSPLTSLPLGSLPGLFQVGFVAALSCAPLIVCPCDTAAVNPLTEMTRSFLCPAAPWAPGGGLKVAGSTHDSTRKWGGERFILTAEQRMRPTALVAAEAAPSQPQPSPPQAGRVRSQGDGQGSSPPATGAGRREAVGSVSSSRLRSGAGGC